MVWVCAAATAATSAAAAAVSNIETFNVSFKQMNERLH